MLEEIYNETEKHMSNQMNILKKDLDKVRTGRVNIKLFESIIIECYGKFIPLNNLSSISIINNTSLQITPWDKTHLQNIEKSIMSANLGVTPSIIDNIIKITFPPMNTERRLELIKHIKKISEQNKINIRNIRRDQNNLLKKLLKKKDITKDEEKSSQNKIQNITNTYISKVDKCLKNKESELMKI